ncbi:nucleotide exchange factor GrpE [Vagococcus entomophilus]|nr:nucleotide exchange factor GrpE [Vagococcus entomophilus]
MKKEKMQEKASEETTEEVLEEKVESTEQEEPKENEPSELELLNEKLEEAEDKFLRAQAEIANMRSRFQKEREDAAKYRAQDLAKELLPAIDNLERALQTEVTDDQGSSLKKGIEMVLESLNHALKQAGIEEIPSLGETFDPNLHQAVQSLPATDDQKSEEIIQVLQKGYKLHDRVLRPTMVVVAQ